MVKIYVDLAADSYRCPNQRVSDVVSQQIYEYIWVCSLNTHLLVFCFKGELSE